MWVNKCISQCCPGFVDLLASPCTSGGPAAAAVWASRGHHRPLLCLITGEEESWLGCTGLNGPTGRSVATVQSPVMEIFNI